MERRFGLLADSVIVQTNHPALMAAAETSFGRFAVPFDGEPVTLRLFVEDEMHSDRAGIAHRAAGDFYIASVPGSGLVADLRRGTATSFVDRAVLDDPALLRYTYVEGPALAMLVGSRGYFAIHASGVALNGIGVALHGPEGAGKTTLAVACARGGLDVFAEDGVFVRAGPRGLEFWGMPWVQRMVTDARELYPELAGIDPRRQPNAELKIEVDLESHYPGRTRPNAHPAAVVILDRSGNGATRTERVDPKQADGVVEVQWPWELDWSERHDRAVELLAELPVYRLHMMGTPDEAVDVIGDLLASLALPKDA
jgi:hypothetical protein